MEEPEPLDRIQIGPILAELDIGVYAEEQGTLQPIEVFLEVRGRWRQAGLRDDLSFALDYAALYQLLVAELHSRRFNLIEALAEHLARKVLEGPGVDQVQVQITKPQALPHPTKARLILERSKGGPL